MYEELSQNLINLFISRTDTYPKQTQNGYIRLDENVTPELIQQHIKGDLTIGAYQFSKDSKVKWVCWDFDGKDLKEELQKAKRLFLKLRDEDKIQSVMLEFSGRKGYHVWVFCEEIDGGSAKIWAEDISKGYESHEIFPKQTEIGDKYGNQVKLPLGIHQSTGNRCVFFSENCDELSFEDSIKEFERIAKLPKLKIPRIVVREIIRTVSVRAAKTDMPQFIKNLINTGVSEGERHTTRFIITKELYHCGYQDEEIKQLLRTFNKNCTPNENADIVDYHINTLLERPVQYLAKEVIEDLITDKELQHFGCINYDSVVNSYKKWIYMEETNALDLCLSVALTRKRGNVPLWIIMIAPSGSGKSELLRPFEDMSQPSSTEIMSKITRNTFLSGVKDEPDFAETLRGNPKLFLTYDFSQFVKLPSEEKGQIWAQLRDLYDGFLERRAAFMVNKKVDNIRVNWLICSTPIVDSELLVQQELGTRELIYRFKPGELKKNLLMDTVWDNSCKLGDMRKELAFVVRKFIEKQESENKEDIKISPAMKTHLKELASLVAVLRAATESDSYTGELTNFVYTEMPTRVLLQLKTVYEGLKMIDDNYSDEKALSVLKDLALSSVHPIRLRIIIELLKSPLSTTQLQKNLGIGWKSVKTQLDTARQLGLVSFTEDDYDTEGEKHWKKKVWAVVESHPVVHYLQQIDSLEKTVDNLFTTWKSD